MTRKFKYFSFLTIVTIFFNPVQSARLNAVQESVFDQNLIENPLKIKDLLKHCDTHYRNVTLKRFSGDVLGYVTPWNNHGYDTAKVFKSKINLISPVWLQLLPDESIAGLHDADREWISRLKPEAQVLPRVIFDKWNGQDYYDLFTDSSKIGKLSESVAKTVTEYNFDGIVLELWSQIVPYLGRLGQTKEAVKKTIKGIAQGLKSRGKKFVLVIPPAVYEGDQPGMFDSKDFNDLKDYVDFFSLMTYDYSNPQRPGPNSPIKWVRKCVELIDPSSTDRSKILLGLNFYGFGYTANGGSHVLNRDLKEKLELDESKKSKFKWDDQSAEHFIEIKVNKQKITIFYPSLKSIYMRIQLAEKLNTGLSIWEMGQGLDYFFDLF